MEIFYATKTLWKTCNVSRILRKRHGERRATLISQRLGELSAADTLEVMRTLPQAQCHELMGNRKGQLTVALDGGWRLVFRPREPVHCKPDGGLDWKRTTAIEIVQVVDYHG